MKKNIAIEVSEFLPRIKIDINQRFPITSSFLLLMFFLRVALKIPLPDILFFLVSFLLLFSIPIDLLINRIAIKKPQTAINYYFGYLVFDLFLLTLIIHFFGGITWIIPSIYLLYVVNIFWLFPKFQANFLVGWAGLLLILFAFGTYFRIFPYVGIFLSEEKNPQNFLFVFTSAVTALVIMSFLAYYSDTFYRILDKKIGELRKKGEELILTKRFLEIEVKKKTKELQKEKDKVAEEIKEKTRELEGKKKIVETQVKNLEKFHKMAVSRELKMTEIKEKIERLKELKLKK